MIHIICVINYQSNLYYSHTRVEYQSHSRNSNLDGSVFYDPNIISTAFTDVRKHAWQNYGVTNVARYLYPSPGEQEAPISVTRSIADGQLRPSHLIAYESIDWNYSLNHLTCAGYRKVCVKLIGSSKLILIWWKLIAELKVSLVMWHFCKGCSILNFLEFVPFA